VFEALIVGLKERGFCFAPLTAPPQRLLVSEMRR
jgi:hypothetical protein